ncbi:MAG: hypothetical protein WKF86_05800 [Acidimicrobiales bacterium]
MWNLTCPAGSFDVTFLPSGTAGYDDLVRSASVLRVHGHPVAAFQVVTDQRTTRPFPDQALLIDGQLYSHLLPAELRDLPMPPRGAPEAEKVAYEAKFIFARALGQRRFGMTRGPLAGTPLGGVFPKAADLRRRDG